MLPDLRVITVNLLLVTMSDILVIFTILLPQSGRNLFTDLQSCLFDNMHSNNPDLRLYTCIVYCFNILCLYVQYYTKYKEYQIAVVTNIYSVVLHIKLRKIHD